MPATQAAFDKFIKLVNENPNDFQEIAAAFEKKYGFNPAQMEATYNRLMQENPQDALKIKAAYKRKTGYDPMGGFLQQKARGRMERLEAEKGAEEAAFDKARTVQLFPELGHPALKPEERGLKFQLPIPKNSVGLAAVGFLKGSMGTVYNIEERIGRFLNVPAMVARGEAGANALAVVTDHLNRGTWSDTLVDFAGQQAGQLALFGGAGKGLKTLGVAEGEAAKTALGAVAKGAAHGAGFQAGLQAIDIAGARSPQERREIIRETPQAILQMALLGGVLDVASGSRYRQQLKNNAPKELPGDATAHVDAKLLDDATKEVDAMTLEGHVDFGVPTDVRMEADQRIRGAWDLREIARQELEKANKQIQEMPDVPVKMKPGEEQLGRVKALPKDVRPLVAPDTPEATAQKKSTGKWTDEKLNETIDRKAIADKSKKIFPLEARRQEQQRDIGKALSDRAQTLDVRGKAGTPVPDEGRMSEAEALSMRAAALENQRNALALWNHSEAEFAKAEEYFKEMTGKEWTRPGMTEGESSVMQIGPDARPYMVDVLEKTRTRDVRAGDPIPGDEHGRKFAKSHRPERLEIQDPEKPAPKESPAQKAGREGGTVVANAEKMGRAVVDPAIAARKEQAKAYGMNGGTAGEAMKTLADQVAQNGEALKKVKISEEEHSALLPQHQQMEAGLAGVLKRMGALLMNAGKRLSAWVRMDYGNKNIIQARAEAVGTRNEAIEFASDVRNLLRKVMSEEARKTLRLLFDTEGVKRVQAMDKERVLRGEAPFITPEVEQLVRSIKESADKLWGVQVAHGLIDEESFRANYMPQFFEDVKVAQEYFRKLPSQKISPFSFERAFQDIYQAAEVGKLKLTSYDMADILPSMVRYIADAVEDSEVKAAARRIPGAVLTEAEHRKLKLNPETRDQARMYAAVPRVGFVREDIYRPLKAYYTEPFSVTKFEKMQRDVKMSVLMIDLVHILNVGRIMTGSPKLFLNPMTWWDGMQYMLSRDKFEALRKGDENLRGYVRQGGNLAGAGGDYGLLANATRGTDFIKKLEAQMGRGAFWRWSHELVFDKTVPVMKAIQARFEIAEAFKKREKGEGFYKNKTDEEIYHHVANNIENAYGNFDFKRSGVSQFAQRMLKIAFLAPEWNLSLFRLVGRAMQEVGNGTMRAVSGGKAGTEMDYWNTRKLVGMAATTYLTTLAANTMLKEKYQTDYDPSKDWFRIVTPMKDPKTGKNIRLKTMGPQFELLEVFYHVIEHEATKNKTDVVRTAKDAANEITDFLGRKLHSSMRVPMEVGARKTFGEQVVEKFPGAAAPISASAFWQLAVEMMGNEHKVSGPTLARAIGVLTTFKVDNGVPPLMVDDYQVTARFIADHRAKQKFYLRNGMFDLAQKENESAIEARRGFIERYMWSEQWDAAKDYVRKMPK